MLDVPEILQVNIVEITTRLRLEEKLFAYQLTTVLLRELQILETIQ
jgi:hypothetical protein